MNNLTLSTALETALNRIEDMLAGDDGQAFKEARKFLPVGRAALAAQPGAVGEPLLPMDSAPKDATMLRLLVEFEEGSFEDDPAPCWTIGTNHMANTSVDEWLFAGWNWTHDCFTQGTGKPIGWLPLLAAAPTEAKPAQDAVDALTEDEILKQEQQVEKIMQLVRVLMSVRWTCSEMHPLSVSAERQLLAAIRAAISAKKGGV